MLRKRQVHLDFHTSEFMTVGDKFNKEQFQNAIKAGHLDSITVFSKCHHGWSYHPTEANEMHLTLKFDLLGAQLEACKEIGVNAPVYISAGYDEKDFIRHPEWRTVVSPNKEEQKEFENEVHFHNLCFNTGYLDALCSQIEEVMVKYNPCGIFLDIVEPRICYCECCQRDIKALGLSIESKEDMESFKKIVRNKYLDATEKAVRKYSDTTTIFQNQGHIPKGDYRFIDKNTHLELESLPTGGWGYDHFPLSAAYTRTIKDKEFLGMTGKFHHSWGEFGGFKHPNALIYEAALSVMSGAGCSVGDQLHPSGEMNMATYNLIGKAYSLVEEKEPWLIDAKNTTDIAVLSAEAITGDRDVRADTGANRMLLEGNYLYDFIDETNSLENYKLLILPDVEGMSDEFTEKVKTFLNKGGKVIASAKSIVKDNKFVLDFGAEYLGLNEFNPTYLVPHYETVNGVTEYVMRTSFYKFKANNGEVVASVQNPYFNRTLEHFCSHMHTPNNPEEEFSGAVINNNIAYIGWDIFSAYALHGHLCFKELFKAIIEKMLGAEKTISVNIPDKAVVTLTRQEKENRSMLHLLYAHTTVRGKGTEVIEDTVPLYNVNCSVKYNKKPSKVVMQPQNEEIKFEYVNGEVKFTVPKVDIHAMVVIEE
ncbi:MAG: beta-galactosidase trimerization domain-containing protein [Clostridia bacterium]|nr:beta-galactosidase trimerization domain-containing protein [Clostridia bacterium]